MSLTDIANLINPKLLSSQNLSQVSPKMEEAPPAPLSKPLTKDRNINASVCKSTPNGLNTLTTEIDTCTSSVELNRNTNFAANTFKLQKDIESLSGVVGDSLSIGDTIFGQFGYGDITKQVKERNTELKTKKEKLLKDVDNSEAIIERSNRDFADVKDTVTEPKKILHFVEDYTLAILSMSYLFMIIAIIYVYTATSEIKIIGFAKIFVSSILLTVFLFMVLFYLA
jgi:hypothetical protein